MPDENVAVPQPSPTPKPQVINWKNIVIGVVIGTVLLGVGGYLIYNAYQPKSSEPTVTATKKATPSAKPATPSAQKDETADWDTFEDKILSYSVKYPMGWFVDPAKSWSGGVTNTGDNVTDFTNFDKAKITNPGELESTQYKITVAKLAKNEEQSLEDYVLSKRSTCCPPQLYGNLEKITVDKRTAYKDTATIGTKESPGRDCIKVYVELNKSIVFAISCGQKAFSETFDNILSTFRFD